MSWNWLLPVLVVGVLSLLAAGCRLPVWDEPRYGRLLARPADPADLRRMRRLERAEAAAAQRRRLVCLASWLLLASAWLLVAVQAVG